MDQGGEMAGGDAWVCCHCWFPVLPIYETEVAVWPKVAKKKKGKKTNTDDQRAICMWIQNPMSLYCNVTLKTLWSQMITQTERGNKERMWESSHGVTNPDFWTTSWSWKKCVFNWAPSPSWKLPSTCSRSKHKLPFLDQLLSNKAPETTDSAFPKYCNP